MKKKTFIFVIFESLNEFLTKFFHALYLFDLVSLLRRHIEQNNRDTTHVLKTTESRVNLVPLQNGYII